MKISNMINRFEKFFPKSYISIDVSFTKLRDGERSLNIHLYCRICEDEENSPSNINETFNCLKDLDNYVSFIINKHSAYKPNPGDIEEDVEEEVYYE